MKPAFCIILAIAAFLGMVYLDNHLPGYNPTETRHHP
jgi:hypothetical protein